MTTSSGRVDRILDQLTPKDWGIWSADEMRRYASLLHFFQGVAQGTFERSALNLPLFHLDKQAQLRHQEWIKEGVSGQKKLSRKLRTEFLALKNLILGVNTAILLRLTHNDMRVAEAELDSLLRLYVFGQTAGRAARWIFRDRPPDGEVGEERLKILKELGEFAQFTQLEKPSESPLNESHHCFYALVEGWSNGFSGLMVDLLAHRAGVQATERRYFEGHPILAREIEGDLAKTIEVGRILAAKFNWFVRASEKLFRSEKSGNEGKAGEGPADTAASEVDLTIDVQELEDQARSTLAEELAQRWQRDATETAVSEILDESGQAIPYFWESFQKAASRVELPEVPCGVQEPAAPEEPTR